MSDQAHEEDPQTGDGVASGKPEIVEGGAIEGGDISGVVAGRPFPLDVSPPKDPERYRATVTYLLLALLGVTIVGHYLGVLLLEWNTDKKTEALTSAYHEALPVVSGLVASAVTYYFTREFKK
jgi:hypothetical protein